MHRPDALTRIEDTVAALDTLAQRGKICYFGSSTFPAELIVEGQWAAERRSSERFATEQLPYSLLDRSAEAAQFPTCERYGLGVMTWSPLSSGWLTGKYREGEEIPDTSRTSMLPWRFDQAIAANQRKFAVVRELEKVANDAGLPLRHLAIAFALQHSAVNTVIIGPRTIEQYHDAMTAADIALDDDLLDRLDEIVPPGSSFEAPFSHHQPGGLRKTALRRRNHR